MTVTELIERSLRRIGVLAAGESLTTEQTADGIDILNDLIYSWSSQMRGINRTTVVMHTLTYRKVSYTIGLNVDADIESARPIRLLGAFHRRDDVDTPIEVCSVQCWYDEPDKLTAGIPKKIYYDPTYPYGAVYLIPRPENSTDEMGLILSQPLAVYTAGSDTISLPPEYHAALVWNHPKDYASEFGLPVPMNVEQRADETLRALKRLHTERAPRMDTDVFGSRKSIYNINTDI